jgi:hypothetical protein
MDARGADSSVGIATGYGMDGGGSIPGRGKIFFLTPQRPEQLWGLANLLLNGYFPAGIATGA